MYASKLQTKSQRENWNTGDLVATQSDIAVQRETRVRERDGPKPRLIPLGIHISRTPCIPGTTRETGKGTQDPQNMRH